MILLNHGLTLAILFFLLNALLVIGTWAEASPKHEPFHSGHSWPGKRLTKRASAEYDTCKTKGNTLKCATEWTDAAALAKFGRSVVATALTRTQLEADGWTIGINWSPDFPEKFVKYVGEAMLSELGINPANNVVVNWEHTVAVDDTHPATGANFQCWYNTADNAIIVDSAWSPSYEQQDLAARGQWSASDSLPAIRQLSDVMWIEWAARAIDPSTIKYIFQMNVVNLQTRSIIEEAIQINGPHDASVLSWEFDTSTETGQALLGTPNGNPQAWFLINHKTALGADQTADPVTGLKTISKVRIWTNEDQCYIPGLDVVDDDEDEDIVMNENEDEDEDENEGEGEEENQAGKGPCYHMLFYVADV